MKWYGTTKIVIKQDSNQSYFDTCQDSRGCFLEDYYCLNSSLSKELNFQERNECYQRNCFKIKPNIVTFEVF